MPESDRRAILVNVGLVPAPVVPVSSDELLLSALDTRPLSSLRSEIDAIPDRVRKALEAAAKLLEPKVRPLAIERATLSTQAEVDAWLSRQRECLLVALRDGPVLVS